MILVYQCLFVVTHVLIQIYDHDEIILDNPVFIYIYFSIYTSNNKGTGVGL